MVFDVCRKIVMGDNGSSVSILCWWADRPLCPVNERQSSLKSQHHPQMKMCSRDAPNKQIKMLSFICVHNLLVNHTD